MRMIIINTQTGEPFKDYELAPGMVGMPATGMCITMTLVLETGMFEPALVVQVDPQAPMIPLPWLPPEMFR